DLTLVAANFGRSFTAPAAPSPSPAVTDAPTSAAVPVGVLRAVRRPAPNRRPASLEATDQILEMLGRTRADLALTLKRIIRRSSAN
ncbi:MAG: hypothetical protein WD468_06175, partial [Pirellulales bacterium]